MMTDQDALTVSLTVLGDRFPLLWNELNAAKRASDFDQRIQVLADDFAAALDECGELTEKRKACLDQVPEELRLARAQIAEKDDFRVG